MEFGYDQLAMFVEKICIVVQIHVVAAVHICHLKLVLDTDWAVFCSEVTRVVPDGSPAFEMVMTKKTSGCSRRKWGSQFTVILMI